MDLKKLSEPLTSEQIDFRVQSVNNGGYATILAYKDARVDMERLDKVVGRGFWQRKQEFKNNRLFCSVGIYNKELGEWIWVEDVGVESNAEAEKGQASDAFKRACFNLGIGRELYDYPVMQIKLYDDEWQKTPKPRATWELKLKEWRWYTEFEGERLSFIAAKDQKGRVRFKWGEMRPKNTEEKS